MELVWSNPSPSRTLYRPPRWEVIASDGTSRIISAAEIGTMADPNLVVKEGVNGLQTVFLLDFCF
jgi:hypothetical protein